VSQSTRQYFESHAVSFDSIYLNESRLSRWFNQVFRKAIYERFRLALDASGDVNGKNVLDIGCGSGRYMVEYAMRGANRVVGVDLSTTMLDLARQMTMQAGVQDRCEFWQADFMERPFAEQFDVVLAMGVFDYLSDPLPFLRKMASLSRDVVIASFPGKSGARMYFRKWRYQLQNCPVFFYSRDELNALVRAVEFKDYHFKYMPYSGTGFVLVGHLG